MSPRPRPSSRPPLPLNCPLEEVLALLAGAWTAQILWFLRDGPRRFGDLRRDLSQVSPKVLTNRLRVMESRDIIERHVIPGNPKQVEYTATPLARDLEPILDSLTDVARRLQRLGQWRA